ncbi:hypothetical protein MSAN_02073000 [Mycena sanguinolenta]|uniref:F-box domain-containing protein n=1 Tax=Mycena sanguinolenta TaxID=230812 RepID=A0A8H7CMU4_9AGAR|nr:hypothetical protein MSAN_02073000 [Mycena sanguinolenta]
MSTLFPSLRRQRVTMVHAREAPFAQLPMELEFLIIDHFEGDAIQLRDLCLVNRAWASHAQYLLFRNVYVRYRNFRSFLAVLETRNDLGRYIITLNIVEGSRWVQTEHQSSVLDAISPILVDKMCNLRTLDLSYKYFGRETAQPAAGWSSISRLQVRFCRFATSNSMLSFFAAFPRLESLDVFHCETRFPVPAWHLKYLAFGEFPQNTLTDWLAADPGEFTVDYFRILSLGPDASSFNALLKKVGSGLRHLELPSMYRVRLPEVPLSIRDCTVLTKLSFSERGTLDSGRGIISLLSQISSPNLTTVSFEIYLKTGHLDMPWEEVDDVLTTDAFENLERVIFNMWGGPFECQGISSFEEAVLLMEDRLVLLDARGLLRFNAAEETRRLTAVPPSQSRHVPARNWIYRKIAAWMARRAPPFCCADNICA